MTGLLVWNIPDEFTCVPKLHVIFIYYFFHQKSTMFTTIYYWMAAECDGTFHAQKLEVCAHCKTECDFSINSRQGVVLDKNRLRLILTEILSTREWGRGGKSTLKGSFKKLKIPAKMGKCGVFSCIKVITINFSVIFKEEIHALEGLLSRFHKASVSGGFAHWPPTRGSASCTPAGGASPGPPRLLRPLERFIHSGAAPA